MHTPGIQEADETRACTLPSYGLHQSLQISERELSQHGDLSTILVYVAVPPKLLRALEAFGEVPMLEVSVLLNMLVGAFGNLTTNPSINTLAAYLFTSCAIIVGIPGFLGILLHKDWFAPTFRFWGKWFVAAPFVVLAAICLFIIHYPARAVEGAANQRWTAERPLGHILVFGANFAAGCFYWPAYGIAELTGLGIANLPRGTRAATPATHGHH